MIEHHCPACGAILFYRSGKFKKFCNSKCKADYYEKKRQEKAEKAAEAAKLRVPLVPESQCKKCKYGLLFGERCGCGYMFATGQPRLLLHPEGLSAECKEFEPRKRKRPRYGR